jgi:hypothetical protein
MGRRTFFILDKIHCMAKATTTKPAAKKAALKKVAAKKTAPKKVAVKSAEPAKKEMPLQDQIRRQICRPTRNG